MRKGHMKMEQKTLWERYTPEQLVAMNEVADRYKACMDASKTERECVRTAIDMATAAGYLPLSQCIAEKRSLSAGDKVYAVYNEKTLILWHIGTESMENGVNLLGAHVDSPRIDVKPVPLYENGGFAYLDTHYYGGIKKYQWTTIPLSIHGVVAKKDGNRIDIRIGEEDSEPIFAISDLLIHLARNQMEKTASKVIEGESLDLIIGSIPSKPEMSESADSTANTDNADNAAKEPASIPEPIKHAILQLLETKYGLEEDDFISAELEIVPAGKARDLGLDSSMIMCYGQDDRICAFTSLFAMLGLRAIQKRTACCILVDKEEIGSVGASGMQSRFFENMTAEVLALLGHESSLAVRRCIQNSSMLSSDVSAGYDPLFPEVFETKNTAYLGKGIVFNKYTGVGGKSGSNDANAEYMAKIRRIMDDNHVSFQMAELGKVDIGGGGTIAYIMANYGMDVIDCGLALLCMHAPMEISSKADIYEAVRGYEAFLTCME